MGLYRVWVFATRHKILFWLAETIAAILAKYYKMETAMVFSLSAGDPRLLTAECLSDSKPLTDVVVAQFEILAAWPTYEQYSQCQT